MEKITITNRSGLRLVIQIDSPVTPKRLVFLAHGMKGFKEQPHIEAFKNVFLKNDYVVVRFDATHALGESDGSVEDVTYDSYVHDLEDVIAWAKKQDWFVSPYALCGHSMGAQSTVWHAEHNPREVSLIAAMAPVVNYDMYIATMDPVIRHNWKTKGYSESESKSRPGVSARVRWAAVESLKGFDLLPLAHTIRMPFIDIVGSDDKPCPPNNQKVLFENITSDNKQLIVVDGLEHSYRSSSDDTWGSGLDEVSQYLDAFINKIIQQN